jgi:mRNA interferase RelE/StbE
LTYSIELTESFQKEFKHLDKEDQYRVLGALERIRVRPHGFALRLSGSNAFRVRIGKLRMIIDIEDESQKIIVLKIGNRENVYSP